MKRRKHTFDSLWLNLSLFVLLTFSNAMVAAQHADDCDTNPLAGGVYYGDFDRIEFGCREFAYRDIDPMEGTVSDRTGSYQLVRDQGVPFVVFDDAKAERWLALASEELLYLYSGERTSPFFWGVEGIPNGIEAMHHIVGTISASSTLTEGDIVYEAENLDSEWLAKPWVEGAPGQGIGEEIRIDQWFSRLWISIGYVSYERPELYEMNSRPSRIRVVSEATGDEAVFELEDTPNPQPIEVPGEYETASEGPIRIIIEDVYPGTRWEDTCVNFIAFF